MHRILPFVLSSFQMDFFLLTEGIILRYVGVTLLIIILRPLDYRVVVRLTNWLSTPVISAYVDIL